MGLFMVFIYLIGTPKLVCVLLLLSGLAFTLTLEYGRLRFPRLNEWAIKAMGPLMRKSEVSKVSGTPFYVGSVLLSVIIFPKSIAILSILFLAIGDPISSVFGILYGDLGPRFSNGKSLIGTAAGMGICCLITFVYFVMNQNTIGASALIALAGGIAGGGAEMIPLDIDDNFSIPLVSGLALWVTYLFVGI
jgi:dolichol kinase